MCEATTIIAASSLALKVGGAIAGHQAQDKAAKANKDAAIKANTEQINGLNLTGTQTRDAAGRTIMQADRQARSADAQARVSAGEAGITGASVSALLGVLERERLDFKETTKANLGAELDQLDAEKRGAGALSQSRINAVPRANPFLTGLQIGGAGLDFATSIYNSRPRPTPKG
jgi:hypothetical protein